MKSKNDKVSLMKSTQIELMSKDNILEVKRQLKGLMLKPRSKWTKEETELFIDSKQSPLKEKLKTVK